MAKGCHPLEVATEILEQADRSEPAVHAPVKIGERVQVVQQGTVDVASILDEQAIVGAGVRQLDRKLLAADGLELGLVEPEGTAEDLAVEAAGPLVIVQPPAKHRDQARGRRQRLPLPSCHLPHLGDQPRIGPALVLQGCSELGADGPLSHVALLLPAATSSGVHSRCH